jgi:hypothetical protein
LPQHAQRLRERDEFGRVSRIENAAHLLLVLTEPAGQLRLRDCRLGKGLEHGQFGGHIGAHRDGHHAAAHRLRLGQRPTARDIAQERQAERLLGHLAGIVQVVPLRDGLGHVGEAHHEASLVARLDHRGKYERLGRHRWSSKPFANLWAIFGSSDGALNHSIDPLDPIPAYSTLGDPPSCDKAGGFSGLQLV